MRSVLTQSRQVVRYVMNHPANRRRRGRQVARAVLFQARGRLGLSTRARIGRHSWMTVELHSTAGSKVVYANPPDFNEMTAWRRILRPGDLFVDVGANVGAYSLWAGECGAEVIAVEPHPDTAARLRRNVALNRHPIEVHQVALADRSGTMRLTSGLDAMNHLIVGDDGADGDGVGIDAPGVEVEVRTLDEIVDSRHPVFLKVDVEGAEELVLRGGQRALSEGRILAMQLEWNSASGQLLGQARDSLAAMLRRYGFALFRPDAAGDLAPCAQTGYGDDVFAMRPEALARVASDKPYNR